MSRENYPTLVFGFISIALVVVQLMNLPIPPTVGWPLVGVFGALAILFFIKGIRKKENKPSSIEQNKSLQTQNQLSVGEMLGWVHVHKCSQCGWGIKVTMFNKVAICPKCGNVDSLYPKPKAVDETDDIKNERPRIETKVRKQHNDFDIEVFNIGEYAKFEAQIEVLEGNSFVFSLSSNYIGYWENTKNDKTELSKGKKDWLKIATLQIQTSPIPIANFRLHYYQIVSSMGSPFPMITGSDSTSWILGDNQAVRPCIVLKVTISSSPSMIDGAFVRIYELSDKGLTEVNS